MLLEFDIKNNITGCITCLTIIIKYYYKKINCIIVYNRLSFISINIIAIITIKHTRGQAYLNIFYLKIKKIISKIKHFIKKIYVYICQTNKSIYLCKKSF